MKGWSTIEFTSLWPQPATDHWFVPQGPPGFRRRAVLLERQVRQLIETGLLSERRRGKAAYSNRTD